MGLQVIRFEGSISGARFASGDTIVVGAWRSSPFGSFADVMWSTADGRRVLLAGDERILEFVGSHYRFDERRLDHARVRLSSSRLRAAAGPIQLEMSFDERRGAASRLLALRPRRIRTWRPWIALEDAILRPLLGPALGPMGSVRTRGRTADGAREWYAVHDFLPATRVHGSIDGEDLGTTVGGDEADAFGFSEFPARAGTVRVTSMIEADGPRSLREVAR